MRKYLLLFLLIVIGFTLWYAKKDFPKTPPTVYHNAQIFTINDQQPQAQAMWVEEGKIKAIGSNEEVLTLAKKAKQVDLKGAIVFPGFIDPHTHFALSMFMAEMVDLSGFTHEDNAAVWKHFEKTVAETPKEEWLVCKGIDPILVDDLTPPSIQYLDKIAPNNPVIIFSQSLHSYWGNTAAFEKAGVTLDTPNPSDHSYYEKDSTGQFTGLIVEQEAFRPFIEVIKNEVLTSELLSRVASDVMLDYARNGNTTIVTTGLTINDEKPLVLTQHLSDEKPTFLGGFLQMIGMLPARQAFPRHFMYMRHDMGHLLPEQKGTPNDFYDMIGIKHWYDGSPYIGSMFINDPYLETDLTLNKLDIPANSKGKRLVEQEKLKEFIKTYHEKGWQIAIHTQGDAAIHEVVNVYQELDGTLDFSQTRHRLEHCLLLPQDELDRMRQLNITPSFHINHLYHYGEALKAEMLGEERGNKILPLKSAMDNELMITLHADQPMFESLPFRLIQTAVERKTDDGNFLTAEEQITLLDAIKALTINAAWQIHKEDQIGSLEKGKYADFVILDKNPFAIPVEELETIQFLATYINGNKVQY